MRARQTSEFDTSDKSGTTTLKGKGADKMGQMFNDKGRKAESFHKQLAQNLEDNKKKYDRQLYADWITKVYDTCAGICLRQDNYQTSELRDVENLCGRNCMRKYDKIYKLYDRVEGKILNKYCEDEDIDADAFMQLANEQVSLPQRK